ncbi:MAG: histidine phosphatase family protein [Ruminococcus sp.]|nr:histidine phosphatase family protein [Ruminococcus sp.]
MKVILIRHGKTQGNLTKRYIGSTDEPLCEEGKKELLEYDYPKADVVISSPMKRCLQTSGMIYPLISPVICGGLRECGFGKFEGKNYMELSDDADYAKWVESGGKLPFPGGESREAFSERCVNAFLQCAERYGGKTAAFIVHGGTVMSVMEALADPKRDYYDYMTENGGGYVCRYEKGIIKITAEIKRK